MKITNWRDVTREDSPVRGYFDLETPSGFLIRECSLVIKDGKRFIGMPQRSWQDRGGRTLYKNLISIPDEARRQKFNVLVLQALRDAGHSVQ